MPRLSIAPQVVADSHRVGKIRIDLQFVPTLTSSLLEAYSSPKILQLYPGPDVSGVRVQIESRHEVELSCEVALVPCSMTRASSELNQGGPVGPLMGSLHLKLPSSADTRNLNHPVCAVPIKHRPKWVEAVRKQSEQYGRLGDLGHLDTFQAPSSNNSGEIRLGGSSILGYWHPRRYTVRAAGIEPTTFASRTRRSTKLSYALKIGAPGRS